MPRYRILAFDGGGVRGVLSAILLFRLNQEFPELLRTTHLVAGTSVGGFIALGIASGKTTSEIMDMFSKKNVKFIFEEPNLLPILKPKYSGANLQHMLSTYFSPSLRFKDLKMPTIVTAFNLGGQNHPSWKPTFFTNYPFSDTKNTPVVEAAMASSAAPVFFPSYKSYIDGGVFANSPSVAAIAFSIDKDFGNQKLDNIVMLSIGTGSEEQKIVQDTTEWGLRQWAIIPQDKQRAEEPQFPLLSVMMNGSVDADTLYSQSLLGDRFHRLNPVLEENIALDDVKAYDDLVQLAWHTDLTPVVQFLRKQWY
ncbi:patatin-like phospholipase family protein [Bacillus sp. 165]|uniref:patatin-like phospholipase family protein n=1 Tax=Bacillus sp. 165 TaxID=1529117 RepID=UPI001ADAC07A|nr:patatin-like phospholipase family protein [Bacillus sp. 165]MBO9129140.1 patatin-like phospholipase family protein [Bacillus sp. 165]